MTVRVHLAVSIALMTISPALGSTKFVRKSSDTVVSTMVSQVHAHGNLKKLMRRESKRMSKAVASAASEDSQPSTAFSTSCSSTTNRSQTDQGKLNQVKSLLQGSDQWRWKINNITKPRFGKEWQDSASANAIPDDDLQDLQWALACGNLPASPPDMRILTLPCNTSRNCHGGMAPCRMVPWPSTQCDLCTNTDGDGISRHYPCICATNWTALTEAWSISNNPICDVGQLCDVTTGTAATCTTSTNHISGRCSTLTQITCPAASPRCSWNSSSGACEGGPGTQACVDDPSRRRSGKNCSQVASSNTRCYGTADISSTDGTFYDEAQRSGFRGVRGVRGNPENPVGRQNMEYQEGLTYCCNTCQTSPDNINFGGGQSADATIWGILDRPELVKTERCNVNQCEDCYGALVPQEGQEPWKWSQDCYGGITSPTGYGQLSVWTDGTQGFSNFSFSVFASCASGDGTWRMRVFGSDIRNAKVLVYINFTLATLYPDSEAKNSKVGGIQEVTSGGRHILDMPQEETFLQVVMVPLEAGPARVRLTLKGHNMDHTAEHCMDVQNCLKELGDGSCAGKELRERNYLQLKCLKDETLTPTAACPADPDEPSLQVKCEHFKICLGHTKNDLRIMLEAAGVQTTPATLVEEAKGGRAVLNASVKQDPFTCVDPVHHDLEALECNCLEDMKDSCGTSTFNTTCAINYACAHSMICTEWKLGHCCPGSHCPTSYLQVGEASATSRRLFARSNSIQTEADNNVKTSVDESLGHKVCT